MTQPSPRSLLERFVDGELDREQSASVRDAINKDPKLRQEYEELVSLKQHLSAFPQADDPGEEYWSNLSSVIAARTVEREHELARQDGIQTDIKSNFWRSAFSAAAALALFISAVVLGSAFESQRAEITKEFDEPVIVTASVADAIRHGSGPIFTAKERERLANSTYLIGAPGMIGRFTSLPAHPGE